MANKRIIELNERTQLDLNDWLIVDNSTSTRKLSISTLLNYFTYYSLIFVDALPTQDIQLNVVYLVPHSGSTTQWDEYIYINDDWSLIGTSTIDLSAIYESKPTVKTATLAAGATKVTFTGIPTTGNYTIDLYTDKASLTYDSVNDSTAGRLVYTFEAQSSATSVYLVIREVS